MLNPRRIDQILSASRAGHNGLSRRSFVTTSPENIRAPEALLAMANCQIELKDPRSAKKTLEELLKLYPKSEAAQAARERLVAMK